MIKINLLREKKKLVRAPKGQNEFGIGLLALGGVAAAVFFLVHSPLASDIESQTRANAKVKKTNDQIKTETKDYEQLKQQFALLEEEELAIQRLSAAKATPAWFLRELGSLLTRGHQPTMSPEMVEKVKNDTTLQWNPAWDPKRVWIERIDEKDGVFTIAGGAQSDTDATQFWLRLQASVFATNVVPGATSTQVDSKTKTDYYKFQVTGRVVY